ncbi:MAG: DUF4159 domain-containing protein [Planctomycetota bacterium]|nr:DUF4159 domain-containing protein [Planctomycetota bacterium]
MATAGLASLFVCYDQLYGADSIQCGATPPNAATIDRGMKWLEKNFAASFNPSAVQSMHYHLYGVERVALASGYKYFGGIEWYRHGTKILLGPGAGVQWGSIWEPAYTILFLARGRNPVLFNKLKRPGDWNNRPRELAHLTRWVSRTLERQIGWQIVDVDSESTDWHDAPILYISGSKAPTFTDAQVARLQRYVREGGTIFSVAECGGEAFRSGMRKLYAKLFPDGEITLAPKTHEIYNKDAGFPMPAGPPMYVVTNGVRVLAYHSDQDLALDWQTNKHVSRPESFQVSFNIARLVTGEVKLMRHRAQSHWPDAKVLAAAAPAAAPLKLARLRFAGNADPEPLALERFRQVMAVHDALSVEIVGPIPIDQLAAQKVRFAHLAGVGPLNLSAAEIAALKAFVEGGGTLLIEAIGASAPFAQQAEKLIPAICPGRPLVDLPADNEMMKLPELEIKSVTYAPRTTKRLGRTPEMPLLKAVLFDDVPRLYLSREDVTTALLGCPYASLDGYSSRSALCLLRNMLSLACRGK